MKTKDNKNMTLKGEFSFDYEITLTITAKDLCPITSKIKLGLRKSPPNKLISTADMEDYISSRANDDGSPNKLDIGSLVFVTFSEYSQPKYDMDSRLLLKKSINTKDDQYMEAITEMVPQKFSSEHLARKYLIKLSKAKTLQAQNPKLFKSLISKTPCASAGE